MNPPDKLVQAITGCVLGTAVGDSIGLPYEGLPRDRVQRLLREPLEHSLLGGCGLVSDDTEHTLMVAQSLHDSGGDVDLFQHRLAARLRWWLLALPPGVGLATARAIVKLWLGFGPAASGVHSAGNGPAMRAALFGLACADDAMLATFVRASTRLTHTDPRAFEAALAVAVAARCAMELGPATPMQALRRFTDDYTRLAQDPAVLAYPLRLLEQAVEHGLDVPAFAQRLGCGHAVTGYALHTVPLALWAWMRHGDDFRQAVTRTVACGGDTDTTGAIVGALVGAGLGPEGIPASWLDHLAEWPRDARWMRHCSARLAARAVALRTPGSNPGPVREVAAAVPQIAPGAAAESGTASPDSDRMPAAAVAVAAVPPHHGLNRLAWPLALVRNLATLVVLLLVLVRRTALLLWRRIFP